MKWALVESRTYPVAAVVMRFATIALVIGVLEWLARAGVITQFVMPPPSEIAAEIWSILGTAQFRSDVAATSWEITVALAVAAPMGLVCGACFWRFPIAGIVFEPFLAALYALPIMVFYPILLVWMGLNQGPIIVLSAALAFVPVALNTMIGLKAVPSELVKLANSLNCSPVQRYRKVLLPAALPLVMSGIQLSFVVCLVVTIAMEFLVATEGLGHRISFEYANFNPVAQWAAIVIVVILASLAVSLMNAITTRIRRDMA